jgi:hypothetical protein
MLPSEYLLQIVRDHRDDLLREAEVERLLAGEPLVQKQPTLLWRPPRPSWRLTTEEAGP